MVTVELSLTISPEVRQSFLLSSSTFKYVKSFYGFSSNKYRTVFIDSIQIASIGPSNRIHFSVGEVSLDAEKMAQTT
jgi:Holliday junction resolvasome RuvABC DNA-binding subunit